MEQVALSEIKNIAEYELERDSFRAEMMALKDRRRVRVGDHLTFLFENRETVRYQVQEMMRVERIVKEADIRHELETYNELVPKPGELSATLLIEFETPQMRQVWLSDLLGLENHVWIEVAGERSRARFDSRQISTDRISSVQYITFPLTPEQMRRFPEGVRMVIDHPKYRAETSLSPEQHRELTEDLK